MKEVRGSVIHYIGGKEMDVNQYLAEGWVLLHIYSDNIDSDHGPAQTPVYILGWMNDDEAPSEIQGRVDSERGMKITEALRRGDIEAYEETTRAMQAERESNQ